jgi:hypothetical protein
MEKFFLLFIIVFLSNCPTAREACYQEASKDIFFYERNYQIAILNYLNSLESQKRGEKLSLPPGLNLLTRP